MGILVVEPTLDGCAADLSVKIPTTQQEKAFKEMFQHMVDTAKIK